ncbi:MAG: hypothetical protein V3W41_08855 [Planctomycetota bacterium]
MSKGDNARAIHEEGKLDRVKELLFGPDLRSLRESVEQVMKVAAENRERCEKLESAVKNVMESEQQRATAFEGFQNALGDRLDVIEGKAAEMASDQGRDREAARAGILEQSSAIRNELEAVDRTTKTQMETSFLELEDSKVDRVVFAGVLNELALTLAGQNKAKPKTESRGR